jgi:hypothetical protein
MKCPECDRDVGLSTICPYCDENIYQTFGNFIIETKVLLSGIQWKSVVVFFIISGIVAVLMVIAGMINHDFNQLQWEAIRRHKYWISPLLLVCLILSVYKRKRQIPTYTIKGRILDCCGIPRNDK